MFSLIWVLPLAGLVLESFRCGGGAGALPRHWGLDNYVRLFRETLFLRWLGNTLLVGSVTAVVQTVFQLSVGYVLSRFRFKGRNFLVYLLILLSMLPGTLTLFIVNGWLREWNLTGANAPFGAIVYYAAGSATGYAVVKGYYDAVDRSIEEAAQVDGATQFQIFYKIFLPVGKPVIIYTMLMGFLLPWSNFAVVDAVLPGYTVADGLIWVFGSSLEDSFETFCARGVVISVPIVILCLLLQKYYIAGETIRALGKPLRPVE